jgi:hypothetical protein
MPSPEHHYQRRAETPITSPHMQAVITDLATYYEVDITQPGAHFNFARPEQDQYWAIANLDGEHLDVARCPVEDDAFMVPDIDLLFAITQNGWQTVSAVYTDAVWEAYAKAVEAQGQTLADPKTNFPFDAFAHYVAQLIEAEVYLEQETDKQAVKALLTLE